MCVWSEKRQRRVQCRDETRRDGGARRRRREGPETLAEQKRDESRAERREQNSSEGSGEGAETKTGRVPCDERRKSASRNSWGSAPCAH